MNPILALKNAFTGAVVPTFSASAPTGWMLLNGSTIGNAASGATRANADTELLFTLLWTNLANSEAAVSGGRGGSAAADYAANKTLTLPDFRCRCIIGAGTGSGLTARTVGTRGGTETHTLAESEMPLHGHPFRVAIQSAGTASSNTTGGTLLNTTGAANQAAFTGTPANTAGQQIGGSGGGGAHANMQPWGAMHYIIKL